MSVWLGKRVRINSARDMTAMWPRVWFASRDEHCNPVFVLHLWPFIGIDVWYRGTGPRAELCDACLAAEIEARVARDNGNRTSLRDLMRELGVDEGGDA